MAEAVREQDHAAFPPNTGWNGSQQELPEEEPSSAATSINVELRRNARDNRKMESTLRAQRLTQQIDEFMAGMAPEARVAAGQPEPSEQEVEDLQSDHVGSTVDELTSDGLVRLILKRHMPHINRLEELEKRLNVPSKDWDRSMQILISLATLLHKIEISKRLLDAQVQARTPIPEPPLSEKAQEATTFSKVDQALKREAGEKVIIITETQERGVA